MPEDNEELGLNIGWDGQSINAKFRSRFFSAWDRFFGLKADRAALATSEEVAVKSALTKSRVTLIEAATATVAKQITENPEQAQKALLIFNRMGHQLENTAATMSLVVEELKASSGQNTASDDQAPLSLDANLLNRWEQYAGGATSEKVREKWARVLAAEIRQPGTFSLKTLRIVDEIESNIAHLFERFCRGRIGGWVPAISHGLTSNELEALTEAALIRSDEFPRSISFGITTLEDGGEWWMLRNGKAGVTVRKDATLVGVKNSKLSLDNVRFKDGALAINVIVFTDSGTSLSTIVPNTDEEAFQILAKALLKHGTRDDIKYIKEVEGVGFVDADDIDRA